MIYIAIAFRWDKSNGHQYIIGASTDLDALKSQAEAHVQWRGGKYGVGIYVPPKSHDDDQWMEKPIHYVASMAHLANEEAVPTEPEFDEFDWYMEVLSSKLAGLFFDWTSGKDLETLVKEDFLPELQTTFNLLKEKRNQ